MKAYISELVVDNRDVVKRQRMSAIVQTPKRLDCTSVIWNCYRDFRYSPSPTASLNVEIFDSNGGTDVKPDTLLGSCMDIPISRFSGPELHLFNFTPNYKVFAPWKPVF
jgi:hypothetical protein